MKNLKFALLIFVMCLSAACGGGSEQFSGPDSVANNGVVEAPLIVADFNEGGYSVFAGKNYENFAFEYAKAGSVGFRTESRNPTIPIAVEVKNGFDTIKASSFQVYSGTKHRSSSPSIVGYVPVGQPVPNGAVKYSTVDTASTPVIYEDFNSKSFYLVAQPGVGGDFDNVELTYTKTGLSTTILQVSKPAYPYAIAAKAEYETVSVKTFKVVNGLRVYSPEMVRHYKTSTTVIVVPSVATTSTIVTSPTVPTSSPTPPVTTPPVTTPPVTTPPVTTPTQYTLPATAVLDSGNVIAYEQVGNKLTVYMNLNKISGSKVAPFVFGSYDGWATKQDVSIIAGSSWASVTWTVTSGQVINFVYGGDKNIPNWADATSSQYWKVVGGDKYLSVTAK